MAVKAAEWHKLPVSLAELCINTTLRCGQSFRWRQSAPDEWSCTLHGRLVSLRQDAHHLHYRAIFPSVPAHDDTLALVTHYFNLGPNLTQLYEQWASADANFEKKAPKFTGVRILRQDPWEALVGFICSSNNNISRISSMVSNLCRHYGPLIATIDDESYHDFPTPESLAGPKVEAHLMQLGFGYRAKYIAKTARIIAEERSLSWLNDLCNPEYPIYGRDAQAADAFEEGGRTGYRKAHEQLLELHGVGPKVADCVCLMGLGWLESVPVDTHVWQIAQRDYKFGKGKHSSLTAATYNAVANRFRKLWGKEAGWAHSVLFTADLKTFSARVTAKTEAKEEVVLVKMEPNGTQLMKTVVNTELIKRKRVKKEDCEEQPLIEIGQGLVTRSKRRRVK